ncbi:MAG TPA: class I SAM-dependent methyltransferase, partial [Acidobacteriota bacterium]|nr:class I SAM-dependent methyltransferase [Acidobacteriota bacterium]
PGGRAAILEFSRPILPGFCEAFQWYFNHILPRIGGLISGSSMAYTYLPTSVKSFPDQKQLADLMRKVGFTDVKYHNLSGGIAALHLGNKGKAEGGRRRAEENGLRAEDSQARG